MMLFTAKKNDWFIVVFDENAEAVSQLVQVLYGSSHADWSITLSTIEEVTEFVRCGGEIFR